MIRARLSLKLWRVWSKALGPKEGANEKEADLIALARTVVFFSYMITNCFIVAGVLRHWNH
ncbi:MAG: hypothetical protein EBY81_00770 [Verrucomicrobia bacterium]|nr:hypothetical protein [Verrucomicrobiota bacterium]NDI16560.1 hypothetical protein [Verrucomicrobiota bacterium]